MAGAPHVPTAEPVAADSHVELEISGMSCASCVRQVEHALVKVPNVRALTVNLATELARIDTNGAVATESLAAAVREARYGAQVVTTRAERAGAAQRR